MTRTYTIVVMGGAGVGKSALAIRFFQQKFVEEYDPTIEENYRKQFEIDNEIAMLDVMDTAGAEEYDQIRNAYILKGEGFILVFSITDKGSFDELNSFHKQILEVKGDSAVVPIVIVGNKSDLERDRKVSDDDAQQFTLQINSNYFETSAKDGVKCDEPFFEVVRLIRRHVPFEETNSKKKKKGACNLLQIPTYYSFK